MPRRREPKGINSSLIHTPTHEEIEAFASAADDAPSPKASEKIGLNPDANRDFKAIRVPFNEYEYSKLSEAAKKSGRTKLNYIRWAILRLAEDV